MKNSALSTVLEFDDPIGISKDVWPWSPAVYKMIIGQLNIHGVTTKQLLDLGMKIQSVIAQIDKENREVDESRLLKHDYDEEKLKEALRDSEGDRP